MKDAIFSKYNIFCLITAFIIFFTSWTVYFKLPYALLFDGLLAVYIVFFFYPKVSKKQQTLFFAFFFISAWYYFPHFDGGAILSGLFRSFVISSAFLIPYNYLKSIYKSLLVIFAIIVGFGIVAHILRILGVYEFPMIEMVFRDDRYYEVYPLLVYQNETSYRFASIFDEPGYLGTLCGFILALESYNFKKIENIIIFLGGLLSLSFAFYVIAAISLIIITIKQKKYGLLVLGFLMIALISYFLPDFFAPIFERPELLSIGTGTYTDSRGGFAVAQNNMRIISSHGLFHMLIGNGYDAPLYYFKSNTNSIASSSVFRLIFQMGYLGLFTLVYFIIRNSLKTFQSLLFSIIFVLSLYQRPHIFELIFIFLLAYNFSLYRQPEK